MGLIGNSFRTNFGNHRGLGEVTARTPGGAAFRYSTFSNTRSQSGATTVIAGAAIPAGGYAPAVFYPPQTSGQMVMRATGDGTMASDLFAAKLMELAASGSGTLSANAALVVSMVLALAGAGDLAATIIGRLNAEMDLTGSGDLAADMHGIASAIMNLTGAGQLEALISGIGDMELDIVVTGTGLTTANVGQAVWSALAAANNEPGTMGEQLNSAGAGGNPWTQVIESGFTAAEILRLLAAVMAGKSSGGATNTVEFTGLDGTTVRIVATVDEAGNRTNVIRNAT